MNDKQSEVGSNTKIELISKPYEYFDTQVLFANKIADITKFSLEKSMFDYTDLYSSLTDNSYGKDEENGKYAPLWVKYIDEIEGISDPQIISDVTYKLFLKQEHSKVEIDNSCKQEANHFGCFKIDYGDYNRQRNQIRLHFSPKRRDLLKSRSEDKHGDLSTFYLEQRRSEFKSMIKYIHDNPQDLKGAKYFKSSTWLQNIPNYQSFFPSKYSLDANRTKKDRSFLGLWGQFIRWDLTPNQVTYSKFKEKLNLANSTEEAINAFPYPVYEIEVPLEEMYELYEIG